MYSDEEFDKMRELKYRAHCGYNENFSSGNYHAFYIDLTRKLEFLMNEMTLYDGIVFYSIYALKYPFGSQYPANNVRISSFIEQLMKYYKNRGRYPKNVWIREYSTAGHHYHLLFLIDSKTITKSASILKKATDIWQECLGIKDGRGLVHLIKTVGERSCAADFKLLQDEESFPSYFIKIIRVARHYAECHDREKLPVDVMNF